MTANSSSAQGDDIWFWAWRPYDLVVEDPEDQRGDLLAFTPDGTTNVLLEEIFPIVLQRVDQTHAFVGASREETFHLYYLSSTEAVEVMPLFEQNDMDELQGHALGGGYRFYMPDIISAGAGRYLIGDPKRDQYALFDTAHNTTTPLDLRPWCTRNCVRVSADGRYIRYRVTPLNTLQTLFVDTDPMGLPYQIYEYDTLTQTERLIFEKDDIEVPADQPIPRADCMPDQYGERWYCELFVGDRPLSQPMLADEKIIVSLDGSVMPVNPDWRLRVYNKQWYFLDLDKNREDCPACPINVFPDGNEAEVFHFKVPPQEELDFWYEYEEIEMLSENYLLLNPGWEPIYVLAISGEIIELGAYACCADPVSQDFYDERSGFLISINVSDPKNRTTELWRLQPLERIASFSISVQPGVRSTFRDYSLVLFNEVESGGPAAVYSYFDNMLYEFEFEGIRGYIDAFPGGVLVVDHNRGFSETFASPGDSLYRWTPDEGLTLILEEVIPIPR